MAKFTTTKVQKSGIALGGIGSGTVELLPDGEFHYWQISNCDRITKVCWEKEVDDGERSTGALSFYIRSKDGNGKTVVRKLGMKTEPTDFTYRMFSWNKPCEKIEFDGKFPVCNLSYIDEALPCNVSLKAVAPFVPHNSDISATPGFYLDFMIENPTDKELEISLLGTLAPTFADNENGRINSVFTKNDTVGIFSDSSVKNDKADCGNFAFSLTGDAEKTYIKADYTSFIKEYIASSAKFGVTQESVLFGWKEDGKLSDSVPSRKPSEIPENTDELTDEQIEALCNEYLPYPFVMSLVERIRLYSENFPADTGEKRELLKHIRKQDRMKPEFGSCALNGRVKLAAGEKKTLRFVLSWYFPNHFSKDGKLLGHYYENLFESSLEANNFLTENSDIFTKAENLSNLIFSTDINPVYPECWSGHLSTIIKSSCYLKNGRFGLWEGLGFCGFHTTDITYHASFGLLVLFPDLQKKQMKMGAAFQREDGRVHHSFSHDLEKVDGGFDRVDMNMQFVLMILRDYLFTGDRDYLESLWLNIQKAMDSIESLDSDCDGLPDTDTKRNTYDAWNFSGIPAYICILWLAALKASVIIAEEMNDGERCKKWSALLEKGKKSLEEKLWNGEYYNLWRDGNVTDECLMTDQLDGEWFLRVAGIGGIFEDEKVADIVQIIFKNNFIPDMGLINATCPEGKKTSLATYKNCQAEAVWTGIGYAFSAMALTVGLNDISDIIVKTIHNNQARFGAFWDHWECGHHYTRPMSSFSTLHALLGIRVNSYKKTLSLNPVIDNATLPLILCNCIAEVKIENGKCTINCIEGSLDGWTIEK